jgi:hypothetical protein
VIAMDSSSEENSGRQLTVAFALLFVWGVMSIAHAYDRRLVEMNETFTEGFKVVGRLDIIADALDHLGVDQQAFLSTGDESFQDGVIESAEALELNIDMLNSSAAKASRPALLAGLSRSVAQIFRSVGESDRIKEGRGKAEAAAYFASSEADISRAKSQSNQLRSEIIRSISDRIWSARGSNTLIVGLLDDARRWQVVAFSNSARPRQLPRIRPR